jgi:nicotinate phosphoribosyltransferase
MRGRGEALHAVRLDSGDLLELARGARALLDEAGFPEVQILASGGLDEYAIESLVDAGAPIDCFAVGTKVGVSADAPYGDCAYKLVAYEGRPVLKLSAKKQTLPGPKQIYRYRDRSGQCVRDVIGCATEPGEPGTATPLLKEVMRDGRRLHSAPSLWELREHFQKEFARLPERHKSLRDPCPYPATISPTLAALREQVVAAIKTRELGSPCIVLS